MPTTRTAPEDSALRYLVLSFGPFDIGASLTAANILSVPVPFRCKVSRAHVCAGQIDTGDSVIVAVKSVDDSAAITDDVTIDTTGQDEDLTVNATYKKKWLAKGHVLELVATTGTGQALTNLTAVLVLEPIV